MVVTLLQIVLLSGCLATASNGRFSSAVLTMTGFGPVRIGMSVQEAGRAAGAPLIPADSPDEACHYLLVNGKTVSVAFMVVDKKVVRVEIADPYHATLSGLRVGDSEKMAKLLYTGRYEIEQHAFLENGHYIIVRSSDKLQALIIETDGNVVTRLRAGALPAAEYLHGCL